MKKQLALARWTDPQRGFTQVIDDLLNHQNNVFLIVNKMETQQKNLNELEKIQNKFSKINYIKSYPILSKLEISQNEKNLIELVYSYNSNNKSFFMNYNEIAEILNIKIQSVKNLVTNLKKIGYLITENKPNFNGVNGGSSTSMVINTELITKTLNEVCKITEENTEEMKGTFNKEYNQQPEKNTEENLMQLPSIEIKKEVLAPQVKLTQEQLKEKEILESLALNNNTNESDFDFGNQEIPSEVKEETSTITFTNSYGDVFTLPSIYNEVIDWCSERKRIFDLLKSKRRESHLIMELENQMERMKELTY